MSNYDTATLVRLLRERTGLERKAMFKFKELDDSSLRRIEGGKQRPKREALEAIIKSIDVPLEGFVYSPIEDQPMDVILLCDRLTQLLDIGDTESAEDIIKQLEAKPKFEDGIHRQFLLSKKAKLWELQEKPPGEIFEIISKGMKETYENFDIEKIIDTVFVFEESELLHTRARVLFKIGELKKAASILENMMLGMKKLPSADREKERLYAPVLLSLAKCLLESEDYERVLEICDLGAEYSASRKIGLYNPDFELCKANALKGIGRLNESKAPLQHAYFGYMLLGETAKANNVLLLAKEEFNIEFNLYGVDNLDFSNQARVPYKRGNPVKCSSLGSMIGAFRKEANLTMEQLCHGICNKSTLQRIEKDEIQASFFILEALTQRLGRDISLYHNFFLSTNDFVAMQLRDRIYILLIERKYPMASELLRNLESIESFMRVAVNRQFVETARADLFKAEHSSKQLELFDMLLGALKVTCPDFDECNIEQHLFSYNETVLINQIASYYINTGQNLKAINIYDSMFRNFEVNYVDEFEKARCFSTMLFNFSTSLGRENRRDEALTKLKVGVDFERTHGRLFVLPGLAFNEGFNIMMLSNKEESIPFFTLAYYCFSMFAELGKAEYLFATRKSVEKHLKLIFD